MIEKWLPLPEDCEKNEKPANNIFVSKDFETNQNKCLVLIQGTGPVRAGIWGRYCCINENLDLGSVIPFVERGKIEGYSCIVLNPNLNINPETKHHISYNETMDRHTRYVWKKFISPCPAKELYIVAHSAGGYCTGVLLREYTEEFIKRVQLVALTDTMMPYDYHDYSQARFMKNVF